MLSARARAEGGFTMIATMGVLLVLLLLTAAALTATVSGRSSASRDTNSTQALQAADDAANLGLERLTQTGVNKATSDQCVAVSAQGTLTTAAIGSNNWCPRVTVPVPQVATGNAGYYASKWSQSTSTSGDTSTTTTARTIVGFATVDQVTRRVALTASSSTTTTTTQTQTSSPLFGLYGVTSYQDMELTNGYYVSGVGIRSNGNLTLNTTSPPHNCHVYQGDITPGPGGKVTYVNGAGTAAACGGSDAKATANLTPAPITLPSSNDNSGTGLVSKQDVTWNASAKTLSMQNQASLTLTGNTYVFCQLNMSNGTLNFNPTDKTKPVQVYFPGPGAGCSGSTPLSQMTIQNQAVINNQTTTSNQTAANLQFYLLGSGSLSSTATPTTTVDINNNSQILATIYAPLSTVKIENQGGIKGAVYAERVTWGGNNPYVIKDVGATTLTGPGSSSTPTTTTTPATSYTQTHYGECTSSVPSASSPNAGC